MSFQYITPGQQQPKKHQLPAYKFDQYKKPENYIIKPDQACAINVALYMNHPLLITGEPGTGKTQLASRISWCLDLGAPLVFNTKSTSIATDLFYTYNSLARFHAAQTKKSYRDGIDFITYNALGKAILFSNTLAEIEQIEKEYGTKLVLNHEVRTTQKQKVVLIDEIDKAPRDFPNDLLNEIENCAFEIQELNNARISAKKEHFPIIIITSNSEKHLSDAFLRRCVYYHIEFPDLKEMKTIVTQRLKEISEPAINDMLVLFYQLRNTKQMKKRPATAEFLVCIKSVYDYVSGNTIKDEEKEFVKHIILSTLIKKEKDLPVAKEIVEKWLSEK
jgi:MoxR-like ATPase